MTCELWEARLKVSMNRFKGVFLIVLSTVFFIIQKDLLRDFFEAGQIILYTTLVLLPLILIPLLGGVYLYLGKKADFKKSYGAVLILIGLLFLLYGFFGGVMLPIVTGLILLVSDNSKLANRRALVMDTLVVVLFLSFILFITSMYEKIFGLKILF